MKKVTMLLVVLALLAAAVSSAYSPLKLVRLEIINNSGETVYIKLEGDLTPAFYYLTVPDGEDMTFTVETDLYKRTTWACGWENKGKLEMTSNVRLNFTTCNVPAPNNGEPTMEKVVYFKYIKPTIYNYCQGFKVEKKTWRQPTKGGCYWRYRY